MKVCAKLTRAQPEPLRCFTYTHMFLALKPYAGVHDGPFSDSDDALVFLDFSDQAWNDAWEDVHKAKAAGKKVTVTVFDPPRFELARTGLKAGLIDEVVVFTPKFVERFEPGTASFSDYFVSPSVFPSWPKVLPQSQQGTCTIGHLEVGRSLPTGVVRADQPPPSTYLSLYQTVERYAGLYVFDTGWDEDMRTVCHYNKAKAVEALMCGVVPLVQSGVETGRYQDLIRPTESVTDYANFELSHKIDRKDVFQRNAETIRDFVALLG